MALSDQKRTRFFWCQQACAAFGLLCSLYLLVQHTRLKSGIQDKASFCSISTHIDCDVVSASQFSEIAGIPLATIGAVYFFIFILFGFLSPPKDKSFSSTQTVLAWLSAIGLGFDVFLFLLWQVVFLKTICIVCIATYLAVFGHWYLNTLLLENRPKGIANAFLQSLKRPILLNQSNYPKFKMVTGGLALCCFILVIFFLPYFIRSGTAQYRAADKEVQQFYAEWKQKPSRKLEVPPHAPSMGNPNAKVQIVVFSDFECPFCHKAAFTMHAGLMAYKDSVQLVFRNFPLDASCNPMMTFQLHAYACRLAKLSLCANDKGKFWPFHDFVFMKLDEGVFKSGSDALYGELKNFFTLEEINQCLKEPKYAQAVMDDLNSGNRLEVKGTPAIFINGKMVSIAFTVETLAKLIQIEQEMP